MSASPKVSLRLSYQVDVDEAFTGAAELVRDNAVVAERGRLFRPVARRDWLAFVLEHIGAETEAETYTVAVHQSGASRLYTLDDRTVRKIKAGELTLEDLVL